MIDEIHNLPVSIIIYIHIYFLNTQRLQLSLESSLYCRNDAFILRVKKCTLTGNFISQTMLSVDPWSSKKICWWRLNNSILLFPIYFYASGVNQPCLYYPRVFSDVEAHGTGFNALKKYIFSMIKKHAYNPAESRQPCVYRICKCAVTPLSH